MLLKCKRERKKLLLNPKAQSTHKRTTTIQGYQTQSLHRFVRVLYTRLVETK